MIEISSRSDKQCQKRVVLTQAVTVENGMFSSNLSGQEDKEQRCTNETLR